MKKILLIATGGTIASAHTEEGLAPAVGPAALLEAVPEIRQFCRAEAVQILNIDSTNLQPENWIRMVQVVRDNYDKYDGFVTILSKMCQYYNNALSLVDDLKPCVI